MQIRLDKFLADAGIGTRSEVKNIIKRKAVTINGVCAEKPEIKVNPDMDEVAVNGKLTAPRGNVTYLLHKPAGYVCAVGDSRFPTVMELVPRGRDLFPVGRLDKDTEGLLLITNDGAMTHRMLSPKSHVDKTYLAVLDGPVGSGYAAAFSEGVDIGDDTPTLPAKLVICDMAHPALAYLPEEYHTDLRPGQVVLLTIQEGRYHQVKRMFHAAGREVIYLKRLSFGSFALPLSLKKGEAVLCDMEDCREVRSIF
ncbi:MAG: rRNA pseudouridine synthase [Lachnospiraceae bacterium]|nr:rRNA pseudouridine synthase [Lachnospiraceae bacterium]